MPPEHAACRSGPGTPEPIRRGRALVSVVVLLALACGLQALNWGFGRRDNADWHRYSTSFARCPVGFRAADQPGSEPVYQPRSILDWRPRWERKSPLEPPYSRRDTGSSFLLWLPGWALNRIAFAAPVLDLRLLGLPSRAVLTCALGALAGALALGAPRGRRWTIAIPLAAVALAAIHFDLAVVSYANTFFRETAGQVGLAVLTAGLALGPRWRGGALWLVALGALFATTSASVHVALLAPLAVLPLLVPAASRRAVAIAVAPVVLAALSYSWWSRVPKLARNAAFEALYYGLLPDASDPDRVIARLELPAESRALVGLRASTPEGRAFLATSDRPTHGDVLAAVVVEPMAFVRLVVSSAGHLAALVDSPGVRSADAPGPPPTLLNAPRSGLWRRSGIESGALALLALAGAVGLAGMRSDDPWRRRLAVLTLFCALGAATELAANLLGDGRSALARHLFLARLLFDQALLFGALTALTFLPVERRRTAPR